METVRVSSKGQIVIPKGLREALQIETGSELAIFAEGDEIRLRQVGKCFARSEAAAGLGLLAKPGRQALEDAEIKRKVGELLKRRNAAPKAP
ncbi:MAG: AbrB/MazE/SpoVT family DNA-binding domain-containing protein [Rhodocyclaceae bacterium]|nr:AbrB/MazE/SpoVT family DNA-binding domain-containing protein [Rhodocyclaceae bacterium]